MSIFVDASALIAIIAREVEAELFANILGIESDRLCSAMSVWETVAGLRKSYAVPVPSAREQVGRYLETGGIRFVGIGEPECEIAAEAYARFGKGRHPAALNMGDCFAYACTKANRAKLLFKGEDFGQTDIARAG